MAGVVMEDVAGGGKHKMVLEGRGVCRMSGVVDVRSFDTNAVLLETVEGMLMMKGEELHVSRLNLEKGEVDIDGKIDSLVYTDHTSMAKKGEGLLTKLFG